MGRRWLLVLAILLCASTLHAHAAADLSAAVPLQHRVYAFLERCEARGLLPGLRDGVRPFSRLQVAQALARADSAAANAELSPRERRELARLIDEFAASLGTPAPGTAARGQRPGPTPRAGVGATALANASVTVRGPDGELVVQPLFQQRTDAYWGLGRGGSERIYQTAAGGTVRGQVGGALGYSSSFLQTLENGTRTYRIRDDMFASRLELPQLKGSRADYHEGKAELIVGWPFARLELAKGDAAWGPGPDDNLGLSANAPSFPMVRLRGDFGPFRFTSLHGDLRPCPSRPDSPACCGTADSAASYIVNGTWRTVERRKHVAAHRLEMAVSPWLDVGLQEVVVYGDRGVELAYTIPVMFLWAAQSYLGDQDNLTMGLDLDLHPGRGLRLYAAYLADDMKKLAILSDDFANKFSGQLGLLLVDPAGLRDTALRVEYVRIEPWVYTHKYPINTYSHYDMPLGHALGPNSDRWSARCEWRPADGLELTGFARRTRHGDNLVLADGTVVNVGGDLHLGYRAQDERDRKQFLAGVVGKRLEFGLTGRWWPLPALSLEVAGSREWDTNVALPPYWDPDTSVARRNRAAYGDGRQTHLSCALALGAF